MRGQLLHFPRRPQAKPALGLRFDPVAGSPFDALTDALLMAQAEAGTLNPGIVAALLHDGDAASHTPAVALAGGDDSGLSEASKKLIADHVSAPLDIQVFVTPT